MIPVELFACLHLNALRRFAGWRAKLLQGSEPIHTEKKRNNRSSHCLFSLCWFSVHIGSDSTRQLLSHICAEGHPVPKGHWEAASNAVQLHSCCTALLGNTGCSAVAALNGTVFKLSAPLVGFFPIHVAGKTLDKDGFASCLIKEICWIVCYENSRNPKSLVLTLGQHKRISHNILIMSASRTSWPRYIRSQNSRQLQHACSPLFSFTT